MSVLCSSVKQQKTAIWALETGRKDDEKKKKKKKKKDITNEAVLQERDETSDGHQVLPYAK